MENDYLWNKTGEDAEIEHLEKALEVFRYQENMPPSLPVKVSKTEPRLSIFSWRPAFALASILILLFGGVAVWLKVQSDDEGKLTIVNSSAEVIKTYPMSLPSGEPKPTEMVLPINKTNTKPGFINTAFRQTEISNAVHQRNKRKVKPEIKLTKAEKYAFNQLMLALSITGSQLKEVRAIVNGGEPVLPETKFLR